MKSHAVEHPPASAMTPYDWRLPAPILDAVILRAVGIEPATRRHVGHVLVEIACPHCGTTELRGVRFSGVGIDHPQRHAACGRGSFRIVQQKV